MDNRIIELKKKNSDLLIVAGSVILVGNIIGCIYAHKTGGKFWRYVGFGFLGGFILGVPINLYKNLKINENNAEIAKIELESNVIATTNKK